MKNVFVGLLSIFLLVGCKTSVQFGFGFSSKDLGIGSHLNAKLEQLCEGAVISGPSRMTGGADLNCRLGNETDTSCLGTYDFNSSSSARTQDLYFLYTPPEGRERLCAIESIELTDENGGVIETLPPRLVHSGSIEFGIRVKNDKDHVWKLRARFPESAKRHVEIAFQDLHSAELSFYSEFGVFGSHPQAMGYSNSELVFPYAIGFNAEENISNLSRRLIELGSPQYFSSPLNTADEDQSALFQSMAHSYCPNHICQSDDNNYHALAIANLDDDSTLDIWLYSWNGSQGTIQHLVDDLGQ